MADISARDLRVLYGGSGASAGAYVPIARAMADSHEVSNSRIDNTTKDDAGKASAMNDVGVQEHKLTVSMIANTNVQFATLLAAAVNAGKDTAHHWFKFVVPGVGDLAGKWTIDSFKTGGDAPDGSGTAEMSLTGTGAITWTPVAE